MRHLKDKCTKALNLLRVVLHTTWGAPGADHQTLIHLYRSLIRSKLDYGYVVYGSARGVLRILDPIQNHALRLGAYRTSSSSSLSVLANEPPLYIRRKRLSMQYCLKLSSTAQNPAYSGGFAGKFKLAFDRKPNQIPPLGIRVHPDLHAIGFKQKDTVQSSILPLHRGFLITLVWSLIYTASIRRILIQRFTEADFMSCAPTTMVSVAYRPYTEGSKIGDQVASAAVARNSIKTVCLPDKASIFRAITLHAISLAVDFIRHSKDSRFVVFSDSK